MDLAETDENENERGNENEKGNGRQEGYKCGIGPRPCKLMIMWDSVHGASRDLIIIGSR